MKTKQNSIEYIRGKRPSLADRIPICESLYVARMRLAALDDDIREITSILKKDYWSRENIEFRTRFIRENSKGKTK